MPDLPTRIRDWLAGYDAELNRFLTLPVERTGGASIAAHLPCDAAALLREALAELERGEPISREGDCWTCACSNGECCDGLDERPVEEQRAIHLWAEDVLDDNSMPPRNGPHPDCPGWRRRT